MLEDHQRAARMTNATNVTWHQFVISRFVGWPDERAKRTSLTIDIQAAAMFSHSHAELRGLLEYSTNSSLPVIFEFVGTLDLETREVLIGGESEESFERCYAGRLSENGRVLELRSRNPEAPSSRQFHLIHEASIAELFGTL